MKKFPGKILRDVIICIVITLPLLLLAGEAALRLQGLKVIAKMRPAQLQSESLEYVPAVFARHLFVPREQRMINRYWASQKYGNPDYYLNEKGYRGRDFSAKKAPGTVRVMIYGGSSVFDLALPEGKDWPHRVQEYLQDDGLTNVEVINAGIPGHASFDALGRLFTEGHLFKPDYVVWYGSWNDIKRFSVTQSLLREMKPHVPEDNPLLYYQNDFDRFGGERSWLYTLLRYRYLNWKLKVGLEGAVPQKKKDHRIAPEALDQFRLDIELFVDCARNIGAVPVLMTEGTLIRKDNQDKEKWRLRHVAGMVPYQFSNEAMLAADEIIRSVAREKNADLIDAKELLVEKDKLLYIDHVHLEDEGSKVLASLVKEHLKRLILNVPKPNKLPAGADQ